MDRMMFGERILVDITFYYTIGSREMQSKFFEKEKNVTCRHKKPVILGWQAFVFCYCET